MATDRHIRMSVTTDDLTLLVDSCSRVGWHIHDTGERIATDDGPEGEAVVIVRVPAAARTGTASAMLAPCR
ncbi:MAG TPA: hypothetical protein VNZ52_12365 [Candidatus Thermoplasmatota archaeon]|nr:hypothetical protein [Candidatus Thermoplasmatota archaeon]